MTVITNASIVGPHAVRREAWLAIEDGTIHRIGDGAAPSSAVDLDGAWVVPGFVDLHMHGGGGHSVVMGDAADVRAAVEFHRRHGTTTTLVSLVTAPAADMTDAMAGIANLRATAPELGRAIAGIHAEGPFLATARCGAQDPSAMIDPDPSLVHEMIAASEGSLRMMTIAAELPRASDVATLLRELGVVVALGHSDATYEQAVDAFASGASVVTHLGNGMRPFHHREPGLFGAALHDENAVCELIADGVHLHPSVVALAHRARGGDGIALITDAVAAAGVGDGTYGFGSRTIDVRDGIARLSSTGALAGSTLTMSAAFANAVRWGVPITDACRAASLTPARVLGLDDTIGSIEPGKAADLVVLDADFSVRAVLVGGTVVHGALAPSTRATARDTRRPGS